MARPSSSHPTELELEILKILWQAEPQTVEQVREALTAAGRELTHSSVITMMNIMVKKQYLKRQKAGRAFEFRSCVSDKEINRGLLGNLVDRVFAGSASALMLELLETSDLDADELKEIRRIINRKAREQ